MWSIRVLTGTQAGQIFPLKKGKTRIGRSPSCDIRLPSNGISKEHCEISVINDKILVTDLKSSNGTFLNGARIQNSMLRIGDKLSFHNIIVDIIPAPANIQNPRAGMVPAHQAQMPLQAQAFQQQPQFQQPHAFHETDQNYENGQAQGPTAAPKDFNSFVDKAKDYIERVALPGVYKLGEVVDFPYVLAGFVFAFMVLVTSLSVIPMIQITQDSIEKESRRRALTIARNLATINQQALLQGLDSALSTDSTRLEEGVKEAIIVSHADGSTIAPPEKAGSYLDLGFIHQARRESKEYTEMLDGSTIGASVPISHYSPEMRGFSVKAHAIVLYDMGSLAVDEERTLSLFIQTFVIASILGSILFFFLLKLIEYPIRSLNSQVDVALREKRDDTKLNFRFDVMQSLVSNINSALSRAANGGEQNGMSFHSNKDGEAENIVQLVGYPCIAINKDYLIVSVNPPFEMLTGASAINVQNQELSSLPDQALQKNIDALLDLAAENINQIASDELEFSGDSYLLSCQCVTGADGTPEYYILTISPSAEADGGAA